MKNLFYTSPKYLQKLKGISSSASEIDEGVKGSYLTQTLTVIPSNWELGGLSSEGVEMSVSDRYRSGFIDVSLITKKLILENNMKMYRINQYDASGVHISQVSTTSTEYIPINPQVKFIRIVVTSIIQSSYTVYNLVETPVPFLLYVKKPSNYGFHPSSTPKNNRIALNNCLQQKGKIVVDIIGDYEIDDSIIIESDTELEFVSGVRLKRTTNNGYAIVNSGAFTRTYNENIKIKGLNLICNGFESEVGTLVYGLRGQVSFHYIKNLVIEDFTCYDLSTYSFGIHVCTFENLHIDKHIIYGNKDGVHLGRGSKFKISNGIYKTYDDPIALNGHDYASSNPELGWITDGIIENCFDLADITTTGYFCRILAGSWIDWFSGMTIQASDTVVSNGKMYRCFNNPNGVIYTSFTAPTHTSGTKIIDGITWKMTQEDIIYSAGVKNVHFKNIFLQKDRTYAFSVHFDKDNYSRSYYPNAEIPIQEDIIFENIFSNATIPTLVRCVTPINQIKVINSILDNTKIDLGELIVAGLTYPKANILLSGCTFKGSGTQELVKVSSNRIAKFKATGSIVEDDTYTPTFSANCTIVSSDII